MKKAMIILIVGLFLCGLTGMSVAGMADDMMKKADDATQQVNEANAEAQKAKGKMDASEKAMKDASDTKSHTDTMMGNMKEAAKEKTNKAIDDIGK